MTMTNELRGYILVLFSTVCFGTGGILARKIYLYEPDPLTVVTFRASIAVMFIFLGLLIFRRDLLHIRKNHIPFFIVYGLLSVTCNYASFFYAVKYTTIATATTLLFTYPALVVIFSTIFLREVLTRRKLFSLLLTFIGVLLVVQCYNLELFQLNGKGILFGLGTSVSVALYTLFGKKAVADYDSWTVVFYAIGFGALFLIIIRTPGVLLQVHYPLRVWIWFLLVALIPTILSYASYTRSLYYLEASKASIVASFEVVTAPLFAFIFLHEQLEFPQIVGAGLVIWGIILLKQR